MSRSDVFLAYNAQDESQARQLKELLIERGLSVFFDKDRTSAGSHVIDWLENAIRTSTNVVVLLGEYPLGPWQKEETYAALQLAVYNEKRVIVALLTSSPCANSLFLNNRPRVDLSSGFTAQAIDELIRAMNYHRTI